MTGKPMNPFRKQAVDWLRDFANLAEGRPVAGVAGAPAGDSRVALALRVAAQQIESLPDPEDASAAESSNAADAKEADECLAKSGQNEETAQPHAKPTADLAHQIAAKSDEELDQAMSASIPPETVSDEDI